MPRDFMCSRITDNSPLRFLDCDMSDKINLYRPKIPYVLQTLFENGEWRTRRAYKKDSEGNTLRGKIKNPTNYNHFDCWKGDWNNFVKSNKAFDLLSAYWKYIGDSRVLSAEIANGIACPPPKLKICIGDREIETSITTPIRMGMKGGSSQNYSTQIIRGQINDLERKLNKNKYHHLLIKGAKRGYGNTTPDRLINCKYIFISNERPYCNEGYNKKRERRHIKEQGKQYRWEVKGIDWDIPPLLPNIYQQKAEILEYVKRRYCFDDIKLNKMNKKYTAKQLVKMYWKDIIDIF